MRKLTRILDYMHVVMLGVASAVAASMFTYHAFECIERSIGGAVVMILLAIFCAAVTLVAYDECKQIKSGKYDK